MKVTIGLPCYNAAAWLTDCIKSILNQTHQDWILLAADDGSQDTTADILNSFAARDSRIVVIRDGKNLGLAARLNQFAQLCETELLFRMDSDDIMHLERLARETAFLMANPDCDLVASAVYAIDGNNQVRTLRQGRASNPTPADLFSGEVIFHPSVAGRREWFRSNLYDESLRLSEDYELWCRQAGKMKVAILDQPLLFYREHGSFKYSKYRSQAAITVAVLRRHGPSRIGSIATTRLIAIRKLKNLVYAIINACGQWEKALDRHGNALSHEQREAAESALRQALAPVTIL